MTLRAHVDHATPRSRGSLEDFLEELSRAVKQAAALRADSFDERMVLAFRVFSMVTSLTELTRRLLRGSDHASRAELVEQLGLAGALSSADVQLLSMWLLRQHSVSLFVNERTCVRWAQELLSTQAALVDAARRLCDAAAPAEHAESP